MGGALCGESKANVQTRTHQVASVKLGNPMDGEPASAAERRAASTNGIKVVSPYADENGSGSICGVWWTSMTKIRAGQGGLLDTCRIYQLIELCPEVVAERSREAAPPLSGKETSAAKMSKF